MDVSPPHSTSPTNDSLNEFHLDVEPFPHDRTTLPKFKENPDDSHVEYISNRSKHGGWMGAKLLVINEYSMKSSKKEVSLVVFASD